MERIGFRHRLFALLMILLTAAFLWKIWTLHPLYSNAAVRNDVHEALTSLADREGWLLSDISIREVTTDAVWFIHRQHHRGKDPEICYRMTLNDSSLHPCDEGALN